LYCKATLDVNKWLDEVERLVWTSATPTERLVVKRAALTIQPMQIVTYILEAKQKPLRD
jgi:hypothetical protein